MKFGFEASIVMLQVCHAFDVMWMGSKLEDDFESDTDGCSSFFYLIKCLNLFPYVVFFHNAYMYELLLIPFIYIQWIV